MRTLAERLAQAATTLAAISETPRIDAEILLAHALGMRRARLLSRLHESVEAPEFAALVERRLAYEPIAYILGEWEFFSLTFEVRPPTLVPRPETEHLVETVLSFIGDRPARVLELGTGTGCVAVAIAYNAPACSVVATDIRPEALELAARNASRNGVANRIRFRQGDLFEALEPGEPPFDVVCSNPPYVEDGAWHELSPVIRLYEDAGALLGGPDGLDLVRRLAFQSSPHLTPGGLLAFEIGMGQHDGVVQLLAQNGYEAVEFRRDLSGIERVALARKPLR